MGWPRTSGRGCRGETNNVEVTMCGTLACVYQTAREFQMLITAILGIIAALLVYSSARAHARAAEVAVEKDREAQARAIANAIWAELAQCLAKLTADARGLRDDSFLQGGTFVLRVSKTPLFDAQPEQVGRLDAEEALAAMHAYQLLKKLDDSYREALAAKSVTRAQIDDLAKLVDGVAGAVRQASERLRVAAGISTAAADRAVTAYSAF